MNAARAALALWLLWPIAGVAAAAGAPAITAEAPALRYVTQPGDTLLGLAERGLVRPQDWQKVARLNGVADPHLLPTGKTLVVPLALLRREALTAKVAAFSGDVKIGGAPVKAGMTLGAGSVIETGANSFVTLVLADDSRVTLPSQSRVRVETLDRIVLDGRIDRKFAIEAGRAEFGVTPRARAEDRFLVRTPVAVAAVRGTEFRLAHDAASGNSVVSVMEGDVASRPLAAAGEVDVGAGKGAVLGAGPTKLATLLPAPVLARPGRVLDEPEVAFSVAPASGVRRHVQLARDAGFVDLFAEAESGEPEIRFSGVENGTLYVRVTAIDADGVEGLASTYAIDRFRTGLEASAGTPPGRPRRTQFRWQGSGGGNPVYDFVLARDEALADRVVDAPGLADAGMMVTNLAPGDWYWRVRMTLREGGKTYVRMLPVRKLTIARPER